VGQAHRTNFDRSVEGCNPDSAVRKNPCRNTVAIRDNHPQHQALRQGSFVSIFPQKVFRIGATPRTMKIELTPENAAALAKYLVPDPELEPD
jgi:hypothetical protein